LESAVREGYASQSDERDEELADWEEIETEGWPE
jgi:hypothetical protein